jgi:hypothetical protein
MIPAAKSTSILLPAGMIGDAADGAQQLLQPGELGHRLQHAAELLT